MFVEQRRNASKANQQSTGAMSKELRSATAPPLQRLREVKQGKDIFQTHPLEVDRVIREALGEIYAGNACPPRQNAC